MNLVGVKRWVRCVWATRLNPSIALRTLLVLFVGVNLTLVCQGHNEGGHHSGVHLIFAHEPEESAREAGMLQAEGSRQENGTIQNSMLKAQGYQTACQTQLS